MGLFWWKTGVDSAWAGPAHWKNCHRKKFLIRQNAGGKFSQPRAGTGWQFQNSQLPDSPATDPIAATLLPWLLPASGLQLGVGLGLVESYKHTPLALPTSSFASAPSAPAYYRLWSLLFVCLMPTWSCRSPALKSTKVKYWPRLLSASSSCQEWGRNTSPRLLVQSPKPEKEFGATLTSKDV